MWHPNSLSIISFITAAFRNPTAVSKPKNILRAFFLCSISQTFLFFLLIDFHGFGDFFYNYLCLSVFFLPLFAPCSAFFVMIKFTCSLLCLSFIYSIFLLSLCLLCPVFHSLPLLYSDFSMVD